MITDEWTRSLRCSTGHCVEARLVGDLVAVRDTNETGKILYLSRDTWRAFVAGAADGDFDLPDGDG